MAVYTQLTRPALEAACEAFGLGDLKEAHGIPQGSINTNYRLETARGRWFLRHTTVRSEADLLFEARLLDHLHASAYPAPVLVRTADGRPFLPLEGGRVSVFHWLTGEERTRADLQVDHARAVGRVLGKLHRVCAAFSEDRPNPYGPETVRGWLELMRTNPDPTLRDVADELDRALQDTLPFGALVPRGVIHADLFLDNVKWIGDRVSAVFDFEMACRDALVVDLAITLNAWCFDGTYQPGLCVGMVQGYEEQRPLAENELDALYRAALFGAVRYTASRIRDFHLSTLPPDRLHPKDYRTYLARVRTLKELGPSGFRTLVRP
ncbi:MAG: homoserine kinase [Myxococcaceae bacterium]|nr:homoserine kinase [Myxococcaceae bacterium]